MDTEAVAFVGNLITGSFGDGERFEITDYASFLTDAMATQARLMVDHPKETLWVWILCWLVTNNNSCQRTHLF